jgi:hypothetical protein
MLSNETRDKIKASLFKKDDGLVAGVVESVEDEVAPNAMQIDKVSTEPEQAENADQNNIGQESTEQENDIHYNGLDILNTSILTADKLNEEVEICLYSIRNRKTKPLLLFCLYKEDEDMDWPRYNMTGKTITDLVKYIRTLFSSKQIIFTYEGYFDHNGTKQIWFQFTNKNEDISLGKYSNRLWWCMVFEIVNTKKVLTFSISDNVTSLFLAHNEFIYLKTNTGVIYEIPRNAYYGNYYKRIAITAVMGHESQGPFASMGPYYYFGPYGRAMRYAYWTGNKRPMVVDEEEITNNDKGKYIRGGLVRFAVFLGNYTISVVKVTKRDDKVNVELIDRKNFTADIEDQNIPSEWVLNYDGVIQEAIRYSDGGDITILEPQYILKNYNQQFPLEYYYVNTSQETAAAQRLAEVYGDAVYGHETTKLVVE